MRGVAVAILCLCLLGCSVGGAGAQSLYGPGGLFLHPSADLPQKGQLTLGVLVLQQRIPPTPPLHTNPTWGSTSLDYGLSEDIEIGATSLAITDFKPSYGGFFKYRFLRESSDRPAMALGVSYTDYGGNNTRTAFLAARKQLSKDAERPIIGHVGVLYISKLAGIDYDDQVLPYGGVEWGLAKEWTLIAEVRPRGKGDFKTSTGLSLRYQYGSGQLLLTWVNTGQSTQPRFGFGVGYTIGTRR